MTAEIYRDDGPVAGVLARLGRQPVPAAAILAGGVLVFTTFRTDAPTAGVLSLAGVAAFVVLASLGHQHAAGSRTAWLVPPLLRTAEYGVIVYLAWRAGAAAPAAAFALLGAVAFHQYDVDHRLRTRGVPPPRAVGQAGLGWDGRILVMTAAAATGIFSAVAVILGALIFAVSVAENLIVWRHRSPAPASGEGGK